MNLVTDTWSAVEFDWRVKIYLFFGITVGTDRPPHGGGRLAVGPRADAVSYSIQCSSTGQFRPRDGRKSENRLRGPSIERAQTYAANHITG